MPADARKRRRRTITLQNKRTVSPPCEEMATDVNVILRDYGVHKTTRKDTLEPSDTTLAISRLREFWLVRGPTSAKSGPTRKKSQPLSERFESRPERALGCEFSFFTGWWINPRANGRNKIIPQDRAASPSWGTPMELLLRKISIFNDKPRIYNLQRFISCSEL